MIRRKLMAVLAVGEGNSLVVSDKTQAIRFALGSSYYPLSTVQNESLTIPSDREEKLPLVFAGYRLSAPDVRYDDYDTGLRPPQWVIFQW